MGKKDGEKKDKKDKKEKKDADDDGEDESSNKIRLVSPIANPLADKKVTKKVLKTVKKAAKAKCIRRGVKEVVKAVRKGQRGLAIIAGDISPLEVALPPPPIQSHPTLPHPVASDRIRRALPCASLFIPPCPPPHRPPARLPFRIVHGVPPIQSCPAVPHTPPARQVICHVPILCEENNLPYVYVPSKEDLGLASMTKVRQPPHPPPLPAPGHSVRRCLCGCWPAATCDIPGT